MSQSIELKAEIREGQGTGDARALRNQKRIPAIVYGGGSEPASISIDRAELTKAYHQGGFYSRVVNLDLGKEKVRAVPREVQVHPVTDVVLHADFLRLVKGHTVLVPVKVNVIGAEVSPGLKRGGNLNLVRHTVDFNCDPEHIPDSITIDVSKAEIGDSIHISHVELPTGATPVISDRDFTIASIVGRVKDEPAPTAAATEGEGEAAAEGAATEENKEKADK